MANDLEKDCIGLTVKLLKGYRKQLLHLEELKKFKDQLKRDYTTQSITYDIEKISRTNKVSKIVEEEVIRTLSKIEELENDIERKNGLINKIDNAINNLSPIHKKIIKYKYIDGLSWEEIIDKTSYSERSLKYKRSDAVKRIAVKLFGGKTFKENESNLYDLIIK